MLKKLVTSGLNAAGPIAGPIEELVKDVVRDALSNVKATKEEIIGSVRKGVSDSISKIDPAQELKKILEDYNIKVEANFSFTKKDK